MTVDDESSSSLNLKPNRRDPSTHQDIAEKLELSAASKHSRRWEPAHVALVVFIAIVGTAETARAQALDVLHAFAGGAVVQYPAAPVIRGADGNLYGTSAGGGTFGEGTVFKVTPAGIITILHSFRSGVDGAAPLAPLIQRADGNFYGTTSRGGQFSPISATVFRMTPDGLVTTLAELPTNMPLRAPLTAAANGTFFVPYTSAMDNLGAVATITTSGDGPVFYLPTSSGGAGTMGALVRATDGSFYGTSSGGGAFGFGTIFKMTFSGIFTVLHEFTGDTDGAWPTAIIQANDGSFYGVTQSGGVYGYGTIFRMTTAGEITILHMFDGMDGIASTASLLQGSDGNFYGTAHGGGSDQGVVYRMTAAGSMSVLHTFAGGETDGAQPEAALLQGADGDFYGTTMFGGGTNLGTVFRMHPSGEVTLLCSLDTADAATVTGALFQASDGNLYGTSFYGGAFNTGTVFRMTPAGAISVVHSFAGGTDGAYPVAGLIQAADGNLYGTTFRGGTFDEGTVFKVLSSGAIAIVHAFEAAEDGARPLGPLLPGPDGSFYGTTTQGGTFGLGTVFKMAANGSATTLHAFAGGGTDGATPEGALMLATDGNLYGTTYQGGASDRGTVFRVTPGGAFTLLYTFTGGSDGGYPQSGLVQAADGNLYGTTSLNGVFNAGTAFRVTVGGIFTVLHAFGGDHDGAYPLAGLIRASNGNLYGTTSRGGTFGGGSVFKMTLSGSVTVLASFAGRANGLTPYAGVIQASDGNLYGTNSDSGPRGSGVAFRLRIWAAPLATTTVTVAQDGHAGVRLTWTPVATATSYIVKRTTSFGATALFNNVTSATFVDATATNGRTYRYTVSAVNESGVSVASYEVALTAGRAVPGDFDGDGTADAAVYRPSTGFWFATASSPTSGRAWGGATDIPAPGDYDGDGKMDLAVFRPATGTFYILRSSTLIGTAYSWGGAGDKPVPGDYDGDGKTDIAIFRPSTGTWYILQSSTGTGIAITWGAAADTPVPGDYDGDGKTDIAVFRPSTGTWHIIRSQTATTVAYAWGVSTDTPVQGDYDGDGKTDIAVFRPSTGAWYIMQSATSTGTCTIWGGGADVPVPGDYDGDGRTDIAVFRPSTATWYFLRSSAGVGQLIWGQDTDIPILKQR